MGVARLVCLSRHDLQLFQRRGARQDRGRDRVRLGHGNSLRERTHRVLQVPAFRLPTPFPPAAPGKTAVLKVISPPSMIE